MLICTDGMTCTGICAMEVDDPRREPTDLKNAMRSLKKGGALAGGVKLERGIGKANWLKTQGCEYDGSFKGSFFIIIFSFSTNWTAIYPLPFRKKPRFRQVGIVSSNPRYTDGGLDRYVLYLLISCIF